MRTIQSLPGANVESTIRCLSEDEASSFRFKIASYFKLVQKSDTPPICWTNEFFILNILEIRQTVGLTTNVRHLAIIIDYMGGEVNVHAMMLDGDYTILHTLASMRVKCTKPSYRYHYHQRSNGVIYKWDDDCHHWQDLKCGITDIIVAPSSILGKPISIPNLFDLMRTPGKVSNYNHWTKKFIIKPSRHGAYEKIHTFSKWRLVVYHCPKSLTVYINNVQIIYINNKSEFCNGIVGRVDQEY